MINKKYCKIRTNINSNIKGEYFGEKYEHVPHMMLTWPTGDQSISFLLLNILLAILDKDLADINYKDVLELLVQPR
jgi:hypothetical protein